MKQSQIEIIIFVLILLAQNLPITNNFEMTSIEKTLNYNHSINNSHRQIDEETNSNGDNKIEIRKTILPDGELKYLSELPLDKLLKIKKSLEEIMKISSIKEINSTFHSPNITDGAGVDDKSGSIAEERSIFDGRLDVNTKEQFTYGNEMGKALPFTNTNQIQRRTASVEPWDSKPSKIQSIFQLSVTALAFLAFAGYLLCMIVQAIKSKGTTYYHPTMSSQNTASIKKRKPSFGRRRRDVLLSSDNRNDTLASIMEEEMSAEPAPEQIYQVLLSMSEGFVKYQNL